MGFRLFGALMIGRSKGKIALIHKGELAVDGPGLGRRFVGQLVHDLARDRAGGRGRRALRRR